MRLSTGQQDRASEVFGNTAVAWFSAGVISPLIIRTQNFVKFIFTFGISLGMSLIFFAASLFLMERVKK